MNRISGRQALAAGFGLIVREPASFLVWCVVCFALVAAPQILSLGPMLAVLGSFSDSGGVATPEVLAAQTTMMRYQPISYLCSLALVLLVPPAIFRAVLFPEERGLFYLRLGAREFWMAIIVIVIIVGYVLAFIVGMIPFLIVTMIGVAAGTSGSGAGAAGGVLLGFLMMLVLVVGVMWGLLRFSMAPVMAFTDKTFRLTESWSLTRGHAGKLFLIALALFVIALVVEIVIFGVFAAWAGAVAPLSSMAKDPQAVIAALGVPFLAAAAVVFSLLTGAAYTVWGGAWAEIYRQLSAKPSDVFV